ncbi:hypothetical protein PENSPDRAFT_695353 [Peniophora sp. CONT]|nr:hypothetical protein PENSPDRAFT_695353 [Peniophora sp. CONT]
MSHNPNNNPNTPNAVERNRATRLREERAMRRAMARVNVAVNTPQRQQGQSTFQTPNLGPPPGLGPPRSAPRIPRNEQNPERVQLPDSPGNTVPSDEGTETVEQDVFGESTSNQRGPMLAEELERTEDGAEGASQYGTPSRPVAGPNWPDHDTTLRDIENRTEQARQEVDQLADTTARIEGVAMLNFLFNRLRTEHPDNLRTYANPQEWIQAQFPEYNSAYIRVAQASDRPRGRETRVDTPHVSAPRMDRRGGIRFFSPVRGEEVSTEDPFEQEDSEATRTSGKRPPPQTNSAPLNERA